MTLMLILRVSIPDVDRTGKYDPAGILYPSLRVEFSERTKEGGKREQKEG
jgi:hypothetical protein